jgi:hypothetical protein
MKLLSSEDINKNLAELALINLDEIEVLSYLDGNEINSVKKNQLLAKAALKSLTQADIRQALAKLAREKLPPDEIEKTLLYAPSKSSLSNERIDEILSQAAQTALRDIGAKDYHGPFRLEAKEFIDLGLAIYGVGSQVKAIFGPGTK